MYFQSYTKSLREQKRTTHPNLHDESSIALISKEEKDSTRGVKPQANLTHVYSHTQKIK